MKSSQIVRHFLYGQYAEASRNKIIKIVIEKLIRKLGGGKVLLTISL